MKHLKRFNESVDLYGGEEEMDNTPSRSEEPLFNMEQLEAAFLSARVSDSKGNPRFQDFRDWYNSEIGSSIEMKDHAFDKHTKFPYAK
jgi:hypothetical protein